jgi:hypothetical protein
LIVIGEVNKYIPEPTILIILKEMSSQYQPRENQFVNIEELKREKDSFKRMVENFASPGHMENPSNNYLIPRE